MYVNYNEKCGAVLIESDWNLKMFTFQPINFMKNGINRIRLEFKVCTVK